jgi:uncharacterized protein DUF6677
MPENISENIPEEIPEQVSAPIPELILESNVAFAESEVPARAVTPVESEPKESEGNRDARSFFVAIAGWIIPGLGHLVQRRIGRAMAGFAAVGAMAVIGLWMRGNVFPARSDDAFGLLGFIADAGSGIFYFLAHTIEKSGPDVSRAAGDYGTRLIATAGVLNMLFVLDALEISRGHKN